MIEFQQDMRKDIDAVFRALESMDPFALVRFGDGEAAMLRMPPADKEFQRATHSDFESWDVNALSQRFRTALFASLETDMDGYCIGINCRRCDWVGREFCVERMRIPVSQQTFAEIFGWANFDRAYDGFSSLYKNGAALVTCDESADHFCPHDIPVNQTWKEDDVVTSLLKETRPIMVAAGPGACTIIHRYWQRQAPEKRVPIIDIGAVLDTLIHNKAITRSYQRDNHWGRTGGPMGPGEKNVCKWPGKD